MGEFMGWDERLVVECVMCRVSCFMWSGSLDC